MHAPSLDTLDLPLIFDSPPSAAAPPPSAPLETPAPLNRDQFLAHLAQFDEFGSKTRADRFPPGESQNNKIPSFTNEFWTSKQRAAHTLHEISYRACFKPQLPRFFIERLTRPGQRVYDPFMGRGTTLIEAALLGRLPAGCDANPLSIVLTRPRLTPPALSDIAQRLREIPLDTPPESTPTELLAFYHPETLREICALRAYLARRRGDGTYDPLDDWIAMVALNRLTGHSPGFFSVYSLPPNQAVSVQSQLRINERRSQTPPRRVVTQIILKKSRQLLKECDDTTRRQLASVASQAIFITSQAAHTPELPDNSVDLVVTSPPFLNVVQYAADNWLRCWFLHIDSNQVQLSVSGRLVKWQETMTQVFRELRRVLKPGSCVAFEVGEVSKGAVALDQAAFHCGLAAGLEPGLLMVNQQLFTKTAQCWGVDNNTKGTNSNRIVLFRKP